MTTELQFRVYGIPAPQGSKTGFIDKRTGRAGMKESSKKVKPWRKDVVQAAEDALRNHPDFAKLTGPVAVRITFYFPRPKYHFRTGKFAGELKPGAPIHQTTNPDVDKCIRSTFDALTDAGVWTDDNLATQVTAHKTFDTLPGASIRLTALAVTL